MTELSPRIEASRSKKARKKNSEAVRQARAKETPAQREVRNAKIALSYRKNAAAYFFNLNTYAGRCDAKKWIAAAEERVRKAEAALLP